MGEHTMNKILIFSIGLFLFFIQNVSAVDISSCQTLSTADTTYTLTTNVTSDGTCFNVTATNITIDGNYYSINHTNQTTAGYGIVLNGSWTLTSAAPNITIKNFREITNGNRSMVTAGIALYNTSNSTIFNNTFSTGPSSISGTDNFGVLLTNSNFTIIEGNRLNVTPQFFDNQRVSHMAFTRVSTISWFNVIKNNTITTGGDSSSQVGIDVSGGQHNFTIENNTIYTNDQGIALASPSSAPSRNHTIIHNTIILGTGTNVDGIFARTESTLNFFNISNNNITVPGTGTGILLSRSASNNTISKNIITVSNSRGAGLRLETISGGTPQNNTVYDNIINISRPDTWINFTGVPGSNYYNISLTPTTNFFGGPNIGGNFYANSTRQGFSETCTDNEFNGICDTTLVNTYSNNTDYLPLALIPTATVPVIVFKEGVYEIRHNGTLIGRINTNEITSSITSGWHHVVLVYDKDGGSNNLKLYIDNVLVANSTITGSIITNDKKVVVGKNFTNSTIDEVKIWRRALNASEISFLYDSSTRKITTSNEKHGIISEENVTIVLAAPGSSYFDNIKIKTGGKKLWMIVPYSKIDINNQLRIGPGEHNLIVLHNGTNSTTGKPIIRITE